MVFVLFNWGIYSAFYYMSPRIDNFDFRSVTAEDRFSSCDNFKFKSIRRLRDFHCNHELIQLWFVLIACFILFLFHCDSGRHRIFMWRIQIQERHIRYFHRNHRCYQFCWFGCPGSRSCVDLRGCSTYVPWVPIRRLLLFTHLKFIYLIFWESFNQWVSPQRIILIR